MLLLKHLLSFLDLFSHHGLFLCQDLGVSRSLYFHDSSCLSSFSVSYEIVDLGFSYLLALLFGCLSLFPELLHSDGEASRSCIDGVC